MYGKVEHQRRAALLPSVSDARLPNRTCTFRYASGFPGTMANAGARIHPRWNRSTTREERRNCSVAPYTNDEGTFSVGPHARRSGIMDRRKTCPWMGALAWTDQAAAAP